MLVWIFSGDEYTELYHQYFVEFTERYFTNGEFENMVNTVSEMIDPYVEKDPTKFCTYEEFRKGVSTLRLFCTLRAESIEEQLNGTGSSADNTKLSGAEEQQDSDDVAEVADLSIEAMGTMGYGFGEGRNFRESASLSKDIPEGFMPADEDPQEMSTMVRPDMQRDDMISIWLLTGGSILILFTGVLYACKYKKYV